MSGDGTKARQRFIDNMKQVAVGAKLARRKTVWTITKSIRRETSIELTMKSESRQFVIGVPVCITGPCLFDVGLKSVTCAPEQQPLRGL